MDRRRKRMGRKHRDSMSGNAVEGSVCGDDELNPAFCWSVYARWQLR
jgi:hypothetical protein